MLSEVAVLWGRPFAAFVLPSVCLRGLHDDRWLADQRCAREGRRWTQQSQWLTERVHAGARLAATVAWPRVVRVWLAMLSRKQWRACVGPLPADVAPAWDRGVA